MNRTPARIAALVVTGGVAATLLSFGAFAGHVPATDRDDTSGPLDVESVVTEGTEQPRWKIITFGSWTAKEIWDAGYIKIELDTIGSARPDYYVLIGSVGTRLFGELWRDRIDKRDYRIAAVRVWRVGSASASAKVPLSRLDIGANRLFYGWSVQTLFTGDRCRRVCFDLVPDAGAITEPLPIETPTATPTPTPTSTPSSSPSP